MELQAAPLMQASVSTVADLGAVRRQVRWFVEAFGVAVPTADDVLLVVSELVTNALRHTGDGCSVVVCVTDDAVEVDVHDDLRTWSVHPPDPDGGRGLAIVRAVGDLHVRIGSTGKVVSCRVAR